MKIQHAAQGPLTLARPGRGTDRTQAANFEGLSVSGKTGGLNFSSRSRHQFQGGTLVHLMTTLANQQQKFVLPFGMTATHKGIETLDAVDEPLLQQKIQCAVDRGGLCGFIEGLQFIQQVVGFDRLMIGPDQFQYPTPKGRESDPPLRAQSFRQRNGRVDASLMVMR